MSFKIRSVGITILGIISGLIVITSLFATLPAYAGPDEFDNVTNVAIEDNATSKTESMDTADEEFSVQIEEELIADLTPMLPYLGIAAVGIIVVIIIVIKKLGSNDDDFDDEFDEETEEPLFENPKFQEIKTDVETDDSNALDPEVLIQHKVRMISKLQENKIGDEEKLEKIKKDLKDYGSFTKADNDYLEKQFAEYEKITHPED